jgi:hypothetical protein
MGNSVNGEVSADVGGVGLAHSGSTDASGLVHSGSTDAGVPERIGKLERCGGERMPNPAGKRVNRRIVFSGSEKFDISGASSDEIELTGTLANENETVEFLKSARPPHWG